MNRLKSLDPPHKGLRNALGQLTLLAGKTDYTSKASVENLQALGKEVFSLLKDHTYTENTYILAPLEKRNPGFIEDYLTDHDEIDKLEDDLHDQLFSFDGKQSNDDGHQFYLDLCDFQSAYLEHIDVEDVELEEEMQKHFTDEELMGHQIEIMQAMSFDMLLLWFKYIVPARRPDENAQVLTGFKSAAPEEAYNAVLDVIRKEISESELNEILSLVK
jgi:hypothetical protein